MRPAVLNPLFAEVTALPGVGQVLAGQLGRLGIVRIRDLLLYLPSAWRQTVGLPDLRGAEEGARVALGVRIIAAEPPRGRGPARLIAEDAAGERLHLTFFGPHGQWLARRWPAGSALTVAGRLQRYAGHWQIVHPEPAEGGPGVDPVYRLTEGVTSRRIEALVAAAQNRVPELPEWIEPSVLAARGWPSWRDALAMVHGRPGAQAALDRLAYDEMLAAQLAWALVRQRRRRRRGRALTCDGRLVDAMVGKLPWRPTGAQQAAFAEIAADIARPAAMLRLLQGDVGSGKTLVAAMALLSAVEGGAQAVLLAPTEILARQHHATLQRLFADIAVEVGFLSGREKGSARSEMLGRMAAGTVDIMVGTHALLQPDVGYRDLALAVIDEQHRFGVAQRLMLADKAEVPPHLLVMTATPIPRTLALARFGEMEMSKLSERPPGRQPIDTRIIAIGRIAEVVDGLERHMAAGRQAYWVCPLLEAGAEDDGPATATPAVARAEALRRMFGPRVALVHGRMKPAERDAEMDRFQRGDAGVLVATTVIEVGVDVPNATLMVIEQAERFGLAQLHQLRGRVGRGSAQSACLLLRAEQVSEVAARRLQMLRSTEDGFAIADADLQLRGSGELLGTRQSGDRGFELASEEQVSRLVGMADQDARLLIERDGGLDGPRGEAARALLYLFEKDTAVGLLRGG
jgi:ATP-dependent DNA helicase RecG